MSTLGNVSGYEPLCNTNSSISKEKVLLIRHQEVCFQLLQIAILPFNFRNLTTLWQNFENCGGPKGIYIRVQGDVDWEKYTERTDFLNVHGSWEWINGNHLPWPNLALEVASLETEAHLLDAVKNYWLHPGRAHDAIAVKLVRSDTIISRIKCRLKICFIF
ncbi:hypothetical protein C2G38_2043159 [Gigaspora rosea]|uniref:Uncharacterized protein n=1 Tax=Gigaspora rosea TaxID=44941 RepID=A0A397UMY3_9GLOM|nr:hypothetical protein C2G38_2043159 [Gigaspora rosea]